MLERDRERKEERERKRFRSRRHALTEYMQAIWSVSFRDLVSSVDKPGDRDKLIQACQKLQSWLHVALDYLQREGPPDPALPDRSWAKFFDLDRPGRAKPAGPMVSPRRWPEPSPTSKVRVRVLTTGATLQGALKQLQDAERVVQDGAEYGSDIPHPERLPQAISHLRQAIDELELPQSG
jgi:hypothetical protein